MTTSRKITLSAFILASILGMSQAHARSTDRQQSMDINADQVDASLSNDRPTVLTGDVLITQGTLTVQSDKAILHLNEGEVSRAVFSGNQVKLTQQMEDGTALDAVANTVDYDLNTEQVVLMGGVVVNRPRGTMRGERLIYNLETGMVNSGGPSAGRVKMHILPKVKPSL